jgi:hypothetical protein
LTVGTIFLMKNEWRVQDFTDVRLNNQEL